jgi:hypothetical protein
MGRTVDCFAEFAGRPRSAKNRLDGSCHRGPVDAVKLAVAGLRSRSNQSFIQKLVSLAVYCRLAWKHFCLPILAAFPSRVDHQIYR